MTTTPKQRPPLGDITRCLTCGRPYSTARQAAIRKWYDLGEYPFCLLCCVRCERRERAARVGRVSK